MKKSIMAMAASIILASSLMLGMTACGFKFDSPEAKAVLGSIKLG